MHTEVNDYDLYESADEETDYQYDPYNGEAYELEDTYHEKYESVEVRSQGGQRVLRLGLLLMVLLLIAAVIIFGVIPYVEATTNHAPPLLPPVQA